VLVCFWEFLISCDEASPYNLQPEGKCIHINNNNKYETAYVITVILKDEIEF
jgi:hypothetical protein